MKPPTCPGVQLCPSESPLSCAHSSSFHCTQRIHTLRAVWVPCPLTESPHRVPRYRHLSSGGVGEGETEAGEGLRTGCQSCLQGSRKVSGCTAVATRPVPDCVRRLEAEASGKKARGDTQWWAARLPAGYIRALLSQQSPHSQARLPGPRVLTHSPCRNGGHH